jgi:N-acetylglucosamine-6-phosphate deacetylase
MIQAFINGSIFTGTAMLYHKVLLVEGDRILGIASEVPGDAVITDVEDAIIAPGFIDLQVYGGGGVYFPAHPSAAKIQAVYEYHQQFGTRRLLITVPTITNEQLYAAIDAVKVLQEAGCEWLLGLHVEGPYINPAKRGAHLESLICPPEINAIRALIEKGRGVIKMMTIAPELFNDELLQLLMDAGIQLSAGHSNAPYAEAKKFFGKGIHVATHLFNAMSAFGHREPGLAGAVMDTAGVCAGIVADGVHVHYAAIRMAKQLMGERLYLVTDATESDPSGDNPFFAKGDYWETKEGILAGSRLTMLKAIENMVVQVGTGIEEALRMAALYPATIMGLDHELGRIEAGYKAEIVFIKGFPSLHGDTPALKLNVY